LLAPKKNSEPMLFKKRQKYKLCDGSTVKIPALVTGYARTKRWSTRTKYTDKQMRFLKWAFDLGAKEESKKITAERAAKLMPLVGTEEGEKRHPYDSYMKKNGAGGCLFSRAELVEKWEIKSFFLVVIVLLSRKCLKMHAKNILTCVTNCITPIFQLFCPPIDRTNLHTSGRSHL
jgi:hypothetical protein